MKVKSYLCIFMIIIVIFFLSSCSNIKTISPLDKNVPEEESAILILPENSKIRRINDKKRSFFRSWKGPSGIFGTKANKLLMPSGTHTFILDYTHPEEGWSIKKVEIKVLMEKDRMYIISTSTDKDLDYGFIRSKMNSLSSLLREDIVNKFPFTGLLPRKKLESIKYEIIEIEETDLVIYLDNVKSRIMPRLITFILFIAWMIFIWSFLRVVIYMIFMGKLNNTHPGISVLIFFAMCMLSILIINYNTDSNFYLFFLSSLCLAIALSYFDVGSRSNLKGLAELNNEEIKASEDIDNAIEDIIESFSTNKIENNIERAIFHFTKATNASPYNAEFVNNRGLAYIRLCKWQSAITDFSKASQLKPKEEKYRYNLISAKAGEKNNNGLQLMKENNNHGAIIEFTEAIKTAPNIPNYFYNRGVAYFNLQDWTSAIDDFSNAIKKQPNSSRYINYRAHAYCKINDWVNAAIDFSELVRLQPDNNQYKNNLEKVKAMVKKE